MKGINTKLGMYVGQPLSHTFNKHKSSFFKESPYLGCYLTHPWKRKSQKFHNFVHVDWVMHLDLEMIFLCRYPCKKRNNLFYHLWQHWKRDLLSLWPCRGGNITVLDAERFCHHGLLRVPLNHWGIPKSREFLLGKRVLLVLGYYCCYSQRKNTIHHIIEEKRPIITMSCRPLWPSPVMIISLPVAPRHPKWLPIVPKWKLTACLGHSGIQNSKGPILSFRWQTLPYATERFWTCCQNKCVLLFAEKNLKLSQKIRSKSTWK